KGVKAEKEKEGRRVRRADQGFPQTKARMFVQSYLSFKKEKCSF
ncbi:MAG: hypothetical protein ACI956_002206, partial [Nonlabens sp.]